MNDTLFSDAKSWPFEEARRILKRINNTCPDKGYVLFETGYGPSGLPHIGTFGEVMRTSMVRYAFSKLSDIPTRLFCFSDDMDGFRKIPDNVPNHDMLRPHLGKPLTHVPDPYEKFESFAHHNNAMLREFLDSFGFDYEFQSATDWYTSGRFDDVLKSVLRHHEDIKSVILPTLGEERRATYSPLLPVCPKTGVVLQVAIESIDTDNHTVSYKDPETGDMTTVPVTGGHCKLQWKADWGARWHAFHVDYEMSGKDLIDSVRLSSKICRILGTNPPENLTYELFLDDQGQKISKSKGNGLTIDEWLKYAPNESLAYYMFQSPKRAKRLFFDVIPKAVDEYLTHLEKYPTLEPSAQIDNPVWHLHGGDVPNSESPLSFSILLNLASVCNAETADVMWGFVKRYVPGAGSESMPLLNQLIAFSVVYYNDFVKPQKVYKTPTDVEIAALEDLKSTLTAFSEDVDRDALQSAVFDVGKRHNYENLREWFGALYEILLGQKQGPRMGSFIALYGVQETIDLIRKTLAK